MSYMDGVTYNKVCDRCDGGFEANHPQKKHCSLCDVLSEIESYMSSRTKECHYRHCSRGLIRENDQGHIVGQSRFPESDTSNTSLFIDATAKNTRRYCSDECNYREGEYQDWERSHPDKCPEEAPPEGEMFLAEQTRQCDWCGSDFTPNRANQKKCNKDDCNEYERLYHLVMDAPPELRHYSPYLTCQECGEEFLGCIPNRSGKGEGHFKSSHDMTYSEYREEHPNSYRQCQLSRKLSGYRQRGQTVDEEGRLRMSKAQQERYRTKSVWNKGLTKDDHDGIARQARILSEKYQGDGNPFWNCCHTEKVKEVLSEKCSNLKQDFVYQRNWRESKEVSSKLGMHISKPHVVMMQAMRDIGLWDHFDFDYEVWITLQDSEGQFPHGIDIACPSPQVAIEIDGCDFHGCPDHYDPQSFDEDHRSFVQDRKHLDNRIDQILQRDGWNVVRLWEHEVKDDVESCLNRISSALGKEHFSYLKSYETVWSDTSSEFKKLTSRDCEIDLDSEDCEIDDVVDFYKIREFPYHSYSSSEIKDDFEFLEEYRVENMECGPNLFEVKRPGLGMRSVKYFGRHYWRASRGDRRSPYERYQEDDFIESIVESQQEKDTSSPFRSNKIRNEIKRRTKAPSSFPATVTKYLVKYLTEGSPDVLDPCVGYGGRLVGSKSVSKSVSYTGVDPWEEAIDNLRLMSDWFGFTGVELYNQPFEDLPKPDHAPFDLVLTSPPHYDKEHYADDPSQSNVRYDSYQEWELEFLRPLFQKSFDWLRRGGTIAIHLTNTSEHDLVKSGRSTMRNVGFDLQNDLLWSRQNIFQGKSRQETILIGKKL